MRIALAGYMLASGTGYAWVVLRQSRLTTSYEIQAEYMPLGVYAVLLFGLGLLMAVTRARRAFWYARVIAVAAFALYVFIGTTWIQAGAFTGVTQYLVGMWILLLEISHVDRGEKK